MPKLLFTAILEYSELVTVKTPPGIYVRLFKGRAQIYTVGVKDIPDTNAILAALGREPGKPAYEEPLRGPDDPTPEGADGWARGYRSWVVGLKPLKGID